MKTILFVCNENSARSQMAEAFFNRYGGGTGYAGASAGLKRTDAVKPHALAVMLEKGIDMSAQKPKTLTPQMIADTDRIYTMGCVKTCPAAPPQKTHDWRLQDPAGQPIEAFRRVRDEIEAKVKDLASKLK
jgi:arsenate reductase (thioredoxin)